MFSKHVLVQVLVIISTKVLTKLKVLMITYGMNFKRGYGASLVAQWLRVCLPVQGTRVRALVWEDPTCRGATGPVSHNY